jgi:heme/copper-type cytochrome/quinol oxidase subunit 2
LGAHDLQSEVNRMNPRRILPVLALIAVAVIAFLVLKPDDSNDDAATPATTTGRATPAPAVTRIRIRSAKPVGGIAKIRVSKGERIRFEVSSDVADEVHVHGYDLKKDVRPGHSVRFDFPATIAGQFEAELESRAEQIAELTVTP